MNKSRRDGFGSKFGVFAAVVGSAVGLGNIWRFPYVTGENGGGAFLLIYFISVIIIGIPVVLSEFIIGRRGQGNSYGSFKRLSPKTYWYLVGLMGIFAAFIILAFYSTIAGWTLEYIYLSVKNIFSTTTAGISNPETVFNEFHTSTVMPVVWQLVSILLTAFIIIGGVQKGIEKYSKILMPLLFLILVILAIKAITLPGSIDGLKFLLYPDFSKINSNVVLDALGQAAFSLSIGMGVLITYGSYIKKDNNLLKTALAVSVTDMGIAVLAGIAIFPALFAFGLSPQEGAGLVFIVLPEIFQQMFGGQILSLLFFILLAIAAITSSISLLEVIVAYFSEEFKIKRYIATIIGATISAVLGVFATISFGAWKNVKLFGKTIFDNFDFLATNILLPLGSFFILIFLGWSFDVKQTKDEITNQGKLKSWFFPVFLFIIRFVAPLAIFLVFLKRLAII
ncbi:MAG: sodium-dependent transporter [Bacteroidales bacterium]|jgi:NSS family neurotransmitter:Na+ symporter|nr:sodium-dependent transporter [Bacteroidales bacterium]